MPVLRRSAAWQFQRRSWTGNVTPWRKCNCNCNWGTCIAPPLQDRGHITESIRILVPVDRMKQECFQITTKQVDNNDETMNCSGAVPFDQCSVQVIAVAPSPRRTSLKNFALSSRLWDSRILAYSRIRSISVGGLDSVR